MRLGDAFLLPTGSGYAFGAVVGIDRQREQAIVRFQALDYATAAIPLIHQWKGTLLRIATEVKPA